MTTGPGRSQRHGRDKTRGDPQANGHAGAGDADGAEGPGGRVPPHNLEAERALLGALLVPHSEQAAHTAEVRDVVGPYDFYDPAHGHVFTSICHLADAGVGVDTLTVHDDLETAGLLSDRFGRMQLLELVASVPALQRAPDYAGIVATTARARRAIGIAGDIADRGYDLDLDTLPRLAEAFAEVARPPALTIGLRLRSVTDAVASPPPEPAVLVEGILRAGELMAMASLRALGKSWWAMQLSLLLAQGQGSFMGTLAIWRPARVLYCQGELDEWGSASRWAMLSHELMMGPPAGVAETFDQWRIRAVTRRRSLAIAGGTELVEFADAELDERLEATIVAGGYDVVILDPWAVYFGGKENDNDQTEAALAKLRDISLRHGTAFVILHHVGKSTDVREPEDLWRGASRLPDWASTRITLLPHYTEAQRMDQGMTRAQARRFADVEVLRRNGRPLDPFSIAFDPDSGWWEKWNDNAVERAVANRVRMAPVDVAKACWESGGWSSLRAAARGLGCAPNTAEKLLAETMRAGLIQELEADVSGRRRFIPTSTDGGLVGPLQGDLDPLSKGARSGVSSKARETPPGQPELGDDQPE